MNKALSCLKVKNLDDVKDLVQEGARLKKLEGARKGKGIQRQIEGDIAKLESVDETILDDYTF